MLGVVILELLESVLNVQPRDVVLGTLIHMAFDHLSLMRALAWTERCEPLPQPIQSFTLNPGFSISSEPGFWPEQIKRLRERLDLTQQEFANLLGFTNTTVSRWENGEAMPADLSAAVLVMLSAALHGHSIDALGPLKEAAGEC